MDSHNSNTMRLSDDRGLRPRSAFPAASSVAMPRATRSLAPLCRACRRRGDDRALSVSRRLAASRLDQESGADRFIKSS
jgi:hypothetical protein